MANCPNCGSNHIQIKQESTVNWGRALAGYALFGVVGGAVGAVTGEERSINYCLDCGTSWKPQDLFAVLCLVEEFTKIKLDMSRQKDRQSMNLFVSNIIPIISKIKEAESQKTELINKAKSEAVSKFSGNLSSIGCVAFLLLTFGGCTVISSYGTLAFFISAFIGFVVMVLFVTLDSVIANSHQKEVDEAVEKFKRKLAREEIENNNILKTELKVWINKYRNN